MIKRTQTRVRRGETSRADWRKLVELAVTCADDAGRGGMEAPDPQVRLMTFRRTAGQATLGAFHTAGAATEDVARAFVRVAVAFARPETPGDLRREMAPVLAAEARFLDAALTRMADTDFANAHRGRPEVWG